MLRRSMTLRPFALLLALSALLAADLTSAAPRLESDGGFAEAPAGARPAPDEVSGGQRRKLLKAFDAALTAFDAGRYAEAADGFEALLAQVEWPEASLNAGWARYVELDLPRAREHAAAAVAGLPGDVSALRLSGLVLHDLGRHQDALARILEGLEALGADGDNVTRARLELLGGATLRLLGRLGEAQASYQRALDAATTAADPIAQAAAHLGLGHVALSRGQDASVHFAAAGTAGAGAAQHEVDLSKAEAAWQAGDRAEAAARWAAAVAGLEKADLPRLSRSGLEVRAALLAWSLGEREDARRRLDAAEEVIAAAGATAALADVRVARSSWAVAEGRLEEASTLLDQAITAQESVQVPVALASSRLARAQLLAEEGDVRGALALARRSLDVFQDAGLREGEQGAWVVIAELEGRAGALADARTSALRAVEIAQELGNPRLAVTARAEVAVILARLGAIREAVVEYELATVRTASSESLLGPRARVRLEVELAAALSRSKEPAEGLPHAQRALAVADAPGAPEDLAPLAEEAVVAVLLESGEPDRAAEFLDERGVTGGRLAEAVADRRGTALFNEAVEAYDAGDYALAASRLRELLEADASPEERLASARKALQDVLSAHGAEAAAAGKVTRAAELWAEASALAEEREDLGALGTLLLLRAQTALELERGGEAVRLATECGRKLGGAEDPSVPAQCWELAGHAAAESQPEAARTSFENALAAWAAVPDSVAHRAELAYNLAVLDQEAEPAVLRGRLEAARSLAREAGDADLEAQVGEWLEDLETP